MKAFKKVFSGRKEGKDKDGQKRDTLIRTEKTTPSIANGLPSRGPLNPQASIPPTFGQRASLAAREPETSFITSNQPSRKFLGDDASSRATGFSRSLASSLSTYSPQRTSTVGSPSAPSPRQPQTVHHPTPKSSSARASRSSSAPTRQESTVSNPTSTSALGAARSLFAPTGPMIPHHPIRRKQFGAERAQRGEVPRKETTASSTDSSSDSDSDMNIGPLLASVFGASGVSGRDSPAPDIGNALLLAALISKSRATSDDTMSSGEEVDTPPKSSLLSPKTATGRMQSKPNTSPVPSKTGQAQSTSMAKKSSWPPPASVPRFKIPPLADQKKLLSSDESSPSSLGDATPLSDPQSSFRRIGKISKGYSESEHAQGSLRSKATAPATKPSPLISGSSSSKTARERTPSPTPENLAQARLLHEVRTARLQALAARTGAEAAEAASKPEETSPRLLSSIGSGPRARAARRIAEATSSASKPQETSPRPAGSFVASKSTKLETSAQQRPSPGPSFIPRSSQKQREKLRPSTGPKFKVPVLSENEKRALSEGRGGGGDLRDWGD